MNIVIEPLRADDAGELLTVQRAAFLRDAQIYNDPFLPSLTQTEEEIRNELLDPNRVFLVAKYAARLVGSVRAVRRDRTLYISRLLTAPDLEGRGIGGSLLRAIELRMASGVEVFELSTGKKSVANIEMYRRHGYVVCGESLDHAGVMIVTMSKGLEKLS
jgi:ribosomal protein S18 acetylase RimI-like enzyme